MLSSSIIILPFLNSSKPSCSFRNINFSIVIVCHLISSIKKFSSSNSLQTILKGLIQTHKSLFLHTSYNRDTNIKTTLSKNSSNTHLSHPTSTTQMTNTFILWCINNTWALQDSKWWTDINSNISSKNSI